MLSFSFTLLFCIAIYQVLAVPVYVGTEATNLYLCDFNEASGNLTLLSTTTAQYPSFLVLHPSKEYLYTVNEVETFNNLNNSGLSIMNYHY